MTGRRHEDPHPNERRGRGPSHPDTSRHAAPRDSHRSDWDARRDFEHPSRDLERDRAYRSMRGDRDTLDYEIDRDFGDAARAMEQAHEYGRDYNRERELDRRARAFDPERIARRPGYSPSGTFRDVGEGGPPRPMSRRGAWRVESGAGHTRYGQRGLDEWDEPEAWMDELRELSPRERPAEADVRLGGTQPSGHGPGVENMARPQTGFSTSRSRPDDHERGHGGYSGAPFRPRGQGPKGYQRADDRIRADLCDRLMQDWMDASDTEVEVRDGVVTLRGGVRSRDEKRAIEDAAEAVLGVKEVLNHLRLHREGVSHPPASQAPLASVEDGWEEDGSLHS
ncbi:phospholipid-binding protein [Myxococcus stipitatus DSM 14675]|uniref:Phospholipid-binding protein n=1 Tax=Myxococcus stipitatus (strain DSM 14675 / JCM 12634 / Mx s8) TaxID=1278073 RepID=L7UE54_MYXSD|nr:BON domain-containing protein [Myxococcus stipitatus]AGC46140.1 phospholipid-binding protein [Myxococcus stipitatus DSM 14675]